MSSEVPIEQCRHCGTPRRIDTWCGTEECAERVAQAQAELHRLIFGDTTKESEYEYRLMCRPPGREARQWSVLRRNAVAIAHDAADCRAEGRWGEAWVERRLITHWERFDAAPDATDTTCPHGETEPHAYYFDSDGQTYCYGPDNAWFPKFGSDTTEDQG